LISDFPGESQPPSHPCDGNASSHGPSIIHNGTRSLLFSLYCIKDRGFINFLRGARSYSIEFTRILADSPLWDNKVNVLQVSDASEHAIQVRALMSAADSSSAWDLRCEVREKLLEFVQQKYPQCLPRNRNELPEIKARVVPADGNSLMRYKPDAERRGQAKLNRQAGTQAANLNCVMFSVCVLLC
jgi:hypothetical protein